MESAWTVVPNRRSAKARRIVARSQGLKGVIGHLRDTVTRNCSALALELPYSTLNDAEGTELYEVPTQKSCKFLHTFAIEFPGTGLEDSVILQTAENAAEAYPIPAVNCFFLIAAESLVAIGKRLAAKKGTRGAGKSGRRAC